MRSPYRAGLSCLKQSSQAPGAARGGTRRWLTRVILTARCLTRVATVAGPASLDPELDTLRWSEGISPATVIGPLGGAPHWTNDLDQKSKTLSTSTLHVLHSKQLRARRAQLQFEIDQPPMAPTAADLTEVTSHIREILRAVGHREETMFDVLGQVIDAILRLVPTGNGRSSGQCRTPLADIPAPNLSPPAVTPTARYD